VSHAPPQVHFSHPQQPERASLSGLSFSCRPGTITCIAGPASCGKGVVPMLLARLYDIQGGKISLDMKDIETYDSRSLRAHLSYVSSEPALFSMSVASNIAYSCPQPPSMSDIVRSLRFRPCESVTYWPRWLQPGWRTRMISSRRCLMDTRRR
jgi:ABC-type multidrug transport system fused ATPase/permease subunit